METPCPKCSSLETIRKGFYSRRRKYDVDLRKATAIPSLYEKIQKYQCQSCKAWFSDQSTSPDRGHKRPDLNHKIVEMVSSGLGIRKMSQRLGTTKKTVQRKVLFTAQLCDRLHRTYMSQWTRPKKPRFQMDEMETFEYKRNQTIKIPTIVEKDSHFIVDAAPLRVKSRSHYPIAQANWNNAHPAEIAMKNTYLRDLLLSCRTMKPQGRIVIQTDMDPSYPSVIAQAFGACGVHTAYNVSKKDVNDPDNLFPVNNIMACMRQDVAAVRGDSWHVGKSKEMLLARLQIYIFFSNYMKTKLYRQRGTKKRLEITPAMNLGIFKEPLKTVY